MLEKQYTDKTLHKANIIQHIEVLDNIQINQENINLTQQNIETILTIKNENRVIFNCMGSSTIGALGIWTYLYFHHTIDRVAPNFFIVAICLGITAGLVGFCAVVGIKYLLGKTKPNYKKLKNLLVSLEAQKTMYQKELMDYLAQKDNQHIILQKISSYYEDIVEQCSEEFAKTLEYSKFRDQILNNFIENAYPEALKNIESLNTLIQSVPTKFAKWQKDKHYLEDYQRFLRQNESMDTFEHIDKINFKRII